MCVEIFLHVIKDVRAQNFAHTDFVKTLTASWEWKDSIKNVKKIGGHRTRFEDNAYHRP